MADARRPPERPGGHGARLVVVQAISLAIVGVLPAFLIGGLAASVRAELGFGPGALGLAVAWFFIATALSAWLLGRDVERRGIRASLTLGAAMSALSLLGIAGAPTYRWLLAALTIGGMANALAQPAVNAALSRRISVARLGVVMGIKQSSVPAATLLGGLAVPTLGAAVGWRWTFTVAAALAASVGASTWMWGPRDPEAASPGAPGRVRGKVSDLRGLVALAAGAALAAATATSLGAFLVDGAVNVGIPEASAGLVFAGASLAGITTRVTLGWAFDRHQARSSLIAIIVLLLIGAPGYLLLALGIGPLYVIGAFLAYGAGWGWPGLLHYLVMSQNPAAPGAATGIIQTGLALGAGVGPLVVGLVAQYASYDLAWIVAGSFSLLSACLFAIARLRLRRALSSGVRRVPTPAIPRVTRSDAAPLQRLREGVRARTCVTGDVRIMTMRIEPGHAHRSRSLLPGSAIVLIEGSDVELHVGLHSRHPQGGDAFSLPVGVVWAVRNRGPDEAAVAVVTSGADTATHTEPT